MSLRERATSTLSSPRGPAWAALVAGLLALPTIFVGELLDDHLIRAWALGEGPVWDAFHFVTPSELPQLRERGMFGWWASDQLSIRFFRPLSSLSHALDHALWPQAVWLMHLENVLLYVLCTLLVARLVARVEGPGRLASLAALVFALDGAHGATVGWISARNTLLALLLGLLCCCAHLRWRAPPGPEPSARARWPWALAAAGTFAASLLAAEGGLCCFGYLLAWSLVFERGAWLRRALPLLPYVVLIFAWRVAYTRAGFGAHGSSLYLDLGAEPGLFALRALLWPAAIGGARLSLPLVDLILSAPALLYGLIALFLALLWALWPMLRDGQDPRPRFWLLAMLFASVPLAATYPTARTLMLSGVGGSVLIAHAWLRRAAQPDPRRGARALLTVMFAAKLVFAPLIFVPIAFSSRVLERPHRTLAARLPEAPEQGAPCLILNVPAELSAFYPWAIRQAQGRAWPRPSYVLFAGMTPLEVVRVDAYTLELRSEAGWAALPIDRFSNSWAQGFAPGARLRMEELEIELLAVNEEGRPTRVRARASVSLDELYVYGFGREGQAGSELLRWSPGVGEGARFQAEI